LENLEFYSPNKTPNIAYKTTNYTTEKKIKLPPPKIPIKTAKQYILVASTGKRHQKHPGK